MSFERLLHDLSSEGVRIHIWPRTGGGFQINVSEPACNSWTVVHHDDVMWGLQDAMRLRLTGARGRRVEGADSPEAQIELEDAIAAVHAARKAHVESVNTTMQVDLERRVVDSFAGLLD